MLRSSRMLFIIQRAFDNTSKAVDSLYDVQFRKEEKRKLAHYIYNNAQQLRAVSL